MANSAATAQAAGVKTPGSGVFSDPAQVGAMIQSMYPQYKNMDPVTLGQRWISVHTPAPASATSATGDLTLQAPTGTTALTTTNPNTPDLSGLNKFLSPVKQQAPQPKPVSLTAGLQALNPNTTSLVPSNGNSGYSLSGNNTLYSAPQIQPQKPKPQTPQGLSTFDISKVRF